MTRTTRKTHAVSLLAALAMYVAPLIGATVPAQPVQARVNPINIILRQMQKPNMLIVLDTSGSMNGVPGTLFTYSTEAGVDCDSGTDCRNWSATAGTCSQSGRSCQADPDCQVSYCKVGMGACASDVDCPTQGFCSKGGKPCADDEDCVDLMAGECGGNKGPYCDIVSDCPIRKQCSLSGHECDNPGNACKEGWCSVGGAMAGRPLCRSDRDCPVKKKGDCSQGGTPAGGCSVSAECPITTRCSVSNDVCDTSADCPKAVAGLCKFSGKACAADVDCRLGEAGQNDGIPEVCEFPANTCEGVPNVCNPQYITCASSAGNNCMEVKDPCQPVDNFCNIAAPNSCVTAAGGDVCQTGIKNPGSLKMCQTSQSVCNTDTDCAAGDVCGEPTSRTVVAKRVLSEVVMSNYDLLNLGFMTFYQSKYYPYVEVTNPNVVEQTILLNPLQLGVACYDTVTGPTATCPYKGITYTLKSGADSVYEVPVGQGNGRKMKSVDAAFCGNICAVPGEGTGWYKGSYYVGKVPIGTVTTNVNIQSTYQGASITTGGKTYNYFTPAPNYYNGAPPPPISVADCTAGVCSATCGARWDTQLAPLMNPVATTAQARAGALQVVEWMAKAKDGGLLTYGGTPTGCTLENSGAKVRESSALHYMADVKASDPKAACRLNYALLITDGEANGPGDQNCRNAACSDDDPEKAGCTCRSVLAAQHLLQQGVRTFVVGFSTDVALGPAREINDNIARAGGTDMGFDGKAPYAYVATNEDELSRYVKDAVLEAVRGSYSTAPATSSSGTQLSNSVASGSLALDARVDFPTWDGHLLAYDVAQSPPVLAWDANVKMRSRPWYKRKIYVGTRDGNVVKVAIDEKTGEITNKATLHSLGLGASADEAEQIMLFALGHPGSGNPNALGAMINSTPIDVGQPGRSVRPGGNEFFEANKNRPNLVYVGASDGMLHAFFTKDTTVASEIFSGGSEAFAYIPPSMLGVLAKLWVMGGQAKDPREHVFGMANSPKVKNMCVANCDDAVNAVWKTLLVMSEGYGGGQMFVLDITNPVNETGFTDPPILPLWHSDNPALASDYAANVGHTISVPAFFYNATDKKDDFRLVFASGYPVAGGSSSQGTSMVVANVRSGAVLDTQAPASIGTCPVIAQEFTMLTDVATEKSFAYDGDGRLRRAYVGDTFGRLWEYDGSTMQTLKDFGCAQPLHFSPAVVQLDRDEHEENQGQSYLVQVTNSSLDDVTYGFAPSHMVVVKRGTDDKGVTTLDKAFGTDGIVDLVVGTDDLCGITNDDKTCGTPLPSHARPASTPIAILKADASGFLALSTWYAADTAACSRGASYLLLHTFNATGFTQVQGLKIADEPVSGPVIAGGRILIVGSNGVIDIGNDLDVTIREGSADPTPYVSNGRFTRLSWSERD